MSNPVAANQAPAGAPDDDALADAVARRARVYDALAEHPDPLLREIGRQLRRGEMTLLDVLRQPEYQRVLERGLRGLQQIDPARLAGLRRSNVPSADPAMPRPG
jgi:hypothetical protein